MTRSISSPILNFSRALRGGGADMLRIGTYPLMSPIFTVIPFAA